LNPLIAAKDNVEPNKSFPAKKALRPLMLFSALRPTEGGITSADAFRRITSPDVFPGITSLRQRASLPGMFFPEPLSFHCSYS